MIKRLNLIALLVLAFGVTAFAQESKVFRSVSSGAWSDNSNWQIAENGVWLPALKDEFPGELHNREVNVRIEEGDALVIRKGDVVHINSLYVAKGNLVVLGDLIIGDAKNAPNNDGSSPIGNDNQEGSDTHATLDATPTPVSVTNPILLQNVPNPAVLGVTDQTTFKFFLDKPYAYARLTVFDELGHEVVSLFDENNVQEGWRNVTLRTTRLQSGSYPVFLELPGKVLRCLMTVVK
jgi:hypothetical protein